MYVIKISGIVNENEPKHSLLKRGTILPTIMIITEKGKNKLSRLSTSVMWNFQIYNAINSFGVINI